MVVSVLGLDIVADDVANDLGDHGATDRSRTNPTDLFCLDVHTEAGDFRETIIEG